MTLEEIIQGCRKNDRRAQAALFKKYKDSLYFLSLKYCRNTAEAEDNLHDAFVTIFESIRSFRGKGSFEGWMKRITIFKAIDKYKSGVRSSNSVAEELLEAPLVDEQELNHIPLQQLLDIIQELPDRYRLVFNLYQLDNYKHGEIAKMLRISENTSKSNYHRAKMILREKINALKNEPKNT